MITPWTIWQIPLAVLLLAILATLTRYRQIASIIAPLTLAAYALCTNPIQHGLPTVALLWSCSAAAAAWRYRSC